MRRRAAPLRTLVPMAQAVTLLGMSRRWIYDRIQSGDLEAFKHSSRSISISRESIIAYQQRTRMTRQAG
jgi:predicted DNA-binding transcriptional regulator AlpA